MIHKMACRVVTVSRRKQNALPYVKMFTHAASMRVNQLDLP